MKPFTFYQDTLAAEGIYPGGPFITFGVLLLIFLVGVRIIKAADVEGRSALFGLGICCMSVITVLGFALAAFAAPMTAREQDERLFSILSGEYRFEAGVRSGSTQLIGFARPESIQALGTTIAIAPPAPEVVSFTRKEIVDLIEYVRAHHPELDKSLRVALAVR